MPNWNPPSGKGPSLENLFHRLQAEAQMVEPILRKITQGAGHPAVPSPSQHQGSQEISAPSLAEARMSAEKQVSAERMEAAPLLPEGPGEGVSSEGPLLQNQSEPKKSSAPTLCSSAEYLTALCQNGLAGAILSGEILGPPAARRNFRRR